MNNKIPHTIFIVPYKNRIEHKELFNNYINKLKLYNKWSNNEIEVYKQNNLDIIDRIEGEINKIENLQELTVLQSKNKSDVNIFNDQKSFQKEILDLHKEKLND